MLLTEDFSYAIALEPSSQREIGNSKEDCKNALGLLAVPIGEPDWLAGWLAEHSRMFFNYGLMCVERRGKQSERTSFGYAGLASRLGLRVSLGLTETRRVSPNGTEWQLSRSRLVGQMLSLLEQAMVRSAKKLFRNFFQVLSKSFPKVFQKFSKLFELIT